MYTDVGVIILGVFVALMLFSGVGVIQWLGVICSTLLILSCQPVFAQTTTYTNPYGAVVGYGYRAGNQTTYVDPAGGTVGYGTRSSNATTYVNPYGAYVGSANRSNPDPGLYVYEREYTPTRTTRREDD